MKKPFKSLFVVFIAFIFIFSSTAFAANTNHTKTETFETEAIWNEDDNSYEVTAYYLIYEDGTQEVFATEEALAAGAKAKSLAPSAFKVSARYKSGHDFSLFVESILWTSGELIKEISGNVYADSKSILFSHRYGIKYFYTDSLSGLSSCTLTSDSNGVECAGVGNKARVGIKDLVVTTVKSGKVYFQPISSVIIHKH